MIFFKRQPSVVACPICGREPRLKHSCNAEYNSIYMMRCPRKHMGTAWYPAAGMACREWVFLIDKVNKRKGAGNEHAAYLYE